MQVAFQFYRRVFVAGPVAVDVFYHPDGFTWETRKRVETPWGVTYQILADSEGYVYPTANECVASALAEMHELGFKVLA